MVTIRKVDAAVMDSRASRSTGATRTLTPKQKERQLQQRRFSRMLSQMTDPNSVFEVRLGKDDKSVTVRQRLLRAAADVGKEVAVRQSHNGFVVGLMTAERRSTRGRKKAGATG